MKLPKVFRTLSGSRLSGAKNSTPSAPLASPASTLSSSSSERGVSSLTRERSGSRRTASTADSPAQHTVEIERATARRDSPASTRMNFDDKQKPWLPSNLERELSDAFSIFDVDGNGKISAAELGTILKRLGENLSEKDLQQMVQAVDANGDGQIDLQEFIDVHNERHWSIDSRSEDLKAAFDMFDIDNNNFISAEELHRVLQGLGDEKLTLEECSQMINRVDVDGDGQVNFEEFERMMSM